MNSNGYIWLFVGLCSTLFIIWKIVQDEDEINLLNVVKTTLIGLIGVACGAVTLLLAILFAWDENNWGDIIVWKRNKKFKLRNLKGDTNE